MGEDIQMADEIFLTERDSTIGKLMIYVHPASRRRAESYASEQAPSIDSIIYEREDMDPTTFYVVDHRYPSVTSHSF